MECSGEDVIIPAFAFNATASGADRCGLAPSYGRHMAGLDFTR
jgi:hypothetical protein